MTRYRYSAARAIAEYHSIINVKQAFNTVGKLDCAPLTVLLLTEKYSPLGTGLRDQQEWSSGQCGHSK